MNELIVLPTPEQLKAKAFDYWCWSANRSSARVLRLLELEYDGIELALPTADTIRQWASRGKWADEASAQLAREYPVQVQDFKRALWQALILANDRVFDVLTGTGRPMAKEEAQIIQRLYQIWGVGTFGANQGGEVALSFGTTEQDEVLSLEQRARRMRAIMSERSRKQATGT